MDNIQSLCANFSGQNLKLENFVEQNQKNFKNLAEQLKSMQQEILSFKNDIDNMMQEIQMELEKSQTVLAKWVSGSNSKLMQEQIDQKRMTLINQAQKVHDNLTQISQGIDKQINDFSNLSQQLVVDFMNTENQLQNISKTSQATDAIPSISDTTTSLQQTLQQVIDALNSARQGLEQQKVLNQINDSIDNLLQ
ncbi:MAG: hypothetical protein PHE70_00250 [Tepidanaerobacteraceae bacterium]|nr:hypothetical protein [Tepidanaerobacteraceae bacterium]